MPKGKLFEPLSRGKIIGSESYTMHALDYPREWNLKEEMEKRLLEAKEEFLKIDPATDDALLDSIYDWFLKYFGEVK